MSMRKPTTFTIFLAFAGALVIFIGTGHASGFFRSLQQPAAKQEITAIAVTSGQNNAPQSEQAKAFVQTMGDQVIDHILNTSLTEAERKQKLENVLMNNFDTYTISRFALGQYWRGLSPKEQQEYQNLFADMIVEIYSSKFSNYEGQEFEVTGVRQAEENDYIVQSMILQDRAKDIPVGWHLRSKDGQFQIVDVTVEDVSMIVTQKSDFASIIQRRGGNPAVILDHLRTKLGEAT